MRGLKFVLLGASGVGKSSLFRRLIRHAFDANQESTLGAAFGVVYVAENAEGVLRIILPRDLHASVETDKCIWKVESWDTAGQERYRGLLPMYYRGAHVALLVHDGTPDAVASARTSMNEVTAWWQDSDHVLCLCQNKSDLPDFAFNADLARDSRVACSGSTSAKTGENVTALFLKACKVYIDRWYATHGNERSCNSKDGIVTVGGEPRGATAYCCTGYI